MSAAEPDTEALVDDPTKVQVVVGLAVRNGEVLLIESRRHGVAAPGGKIEPGEHYVEAIKREFMEEVGLEVTAVGHRMLSDRRHDAFDVHVYDVTVAEGQPVAGGDAIRAWWGHPDEIRRSRIPRDYSLVMELVRRQRDRAEAGPPAPGEMLPYRRCDVSTGYLCRVLRENVREPNSMGLGLSLGDGWSGDDAEEAKGEPGFTGVRLKPKPRGPIWRINYCPWCGGNLKMTTAKKRPAATAEGATR